MPNFLTNFSLFGNHKKSELENINTSTTTQLSETITVGKPLSKKEKREWNDRWEIRNTSLQILKMKVFERMGENDDVKRALLSLSDEDMVFLR